MLKALDFNEYLKRFISLESHQRISIALRMEGFPAWSKTVPEVLSHLKVDPARGLSPAEVEEKRREHGYNELAKQSSTPLWKLVLSQFDDMLVKARHSIDLTFDHRLTGLAGRCNSLLCPSLLRGGVLGGGNASIHRAIRHSSHFNTQCDSRSMARIQRRGRSAGFEGYPERALRRHTGGQTSEPTLT